MGGLKLTVLLRIPLNLRSSCFYLLSAEIPGMCTLPSLCSTGDQTHGLVHARQELYQWGHICSPSSKFYLISNACSCVYMCTSMPCVCEGQKSALDVVPRELSTLFFPLEPAACLIRLPSPRDLSVPVSSELRVQTWSTFSAFYQTN